MVKNLPAGDIRSTGLILGWENPVEEGLASHSSILAQGISWTEAPGRLWSVRLKKLDTTERT